MFGSENSESIQPTRRAKPTPGTDPSLSPPSAGPGKDEPGRESELRLNELLRRLPDAPISFNFTARVVSQAERLASERKRGAWLVRGRALADGLLALGWAPRLAVGTAVVALTLAGVVQHRAAAREEMARSVVAVSNVAALPSWEALVYFDAVQRLPATPASRKVDVELLAALR